MACLWKQPTKTTRAKEARLEVLRQFLAKNDKDDGCVFFEKDTQDGDVNTTSRSESEAICRLQHDMGEAIRHSPRIIGKSTVKREKLKYDVRTLSKEQLSSTSDNNHRHRQSTHWIHRHYRYHLSEVGRPPIIIIIHRSIQSAVHRSQMSCVLVPCEPVPAGHSRYAENARSTKQLLVLVACLFIRSDKYLGLVFLVRI